jgi:hypothetical protein
MTNNKKATPGDQFHWTRSGMTYSVNESSSGVGAISQRGQTVTLTQTLIDSNRNRYGETFLDLIHDDEAQVKRWKHTFMAAGEAPADMTPWTPGTVEEELAREDASRKVYAIPAGIERQRALRDIAATFGAPPSSQVSSALDGGLPGLDGGTR